MTKYRLKKKVKFPLFLGFVGIFLVILFFVYIVLVSPVDKNSSAMIQVKISQGMSTKEIAKELKKRGLIRSELLFDIVVKVNTRKSLKAAVYQFQKSTRNSGAALPDIAFLKKITTGAKEKWDSYAGQYLNIAVGAI